VVIRLAYKYGVLRDIIQMGPGPFPYSKNGMEVSISLNCYWVLSFLTLFCGAILI
jgi:hypothetical protein